MYTYNYIYKRIYDYVFLCIFIDIFNLHISEGELIAAVADTKILQFLTAQDIKGYAGTFDAHINIYIYIYTYYIYVYIYMYI
jgi:hypothetical protein